MFTPARLWMCWAVMLCALIVGTWVTVVLSELSGQCGPEWISLTVDSIAVLVTLIAVALVLVRAVARALRGWRRASEVRGRVRDGYYSGVRTAPLAYRDEEPPSERWW